LSWIYHYLGYKFFDNFDIFALIDYKLKEGFEYYPAWVVIVLFLCLFGIYLCEIDWELLISEEDEFEELELNELEEFEELDD
jgi:hypothetical protein